MTIVVWAVLLSSYLVSGDQLWARWSEWSDCSVECGDGVQFQVRRCLSPRCQGAVKRYRVCKTEECLEDDDVEKECHKRGALHFVADSSHAGVWTSSLAVDSCQAICKSLTKNEVFFLDRTLRNGAKCLRSDGQNGVCLRGKCQAIGCDRIIGSSAKVDHCGNCGGDSRNCNKTLFVWKETGQFSPCDQHCGPIRHQVSVSICKNSKNDRIVPERMCADLERPRPRVRKCPPTSCQANWTTGPWGSCSASCGRGHQVRAVQCIDLANPDGPAIDEHYCIGVKRPLRQRLCVQNECPRWSPGDWSTCICHLGIKERDIDCTQNGIRITESACTVRDRPKSVMECECRPEDPASKDKTSEGRESTRFAEASPFLQWNANDGFSGASASGFTSNELSAKPQTRPQYKPAEWSECSSSCGPGFQTRKVECVAEQGITESLATLPDFECSGLQKPSMYQPCERKACSQEEERAANEVGKGPFRWEYGEWGPCSASCLGGKQKSTLKCLDMSRNLAVPWSNCRAKQRPVDLTRACNTDPCPPTWESVEFSGCSHTCGGGIRSRKVRCIRKVANGASPENVLILPDAQCYLPKPQDQEPCGVVDCPFNWRVESWSPCSKSCGQGEQHRVVVCERRDASGNVHSFNPPLPCAGLQRPPTLQLCNLESCDKNYNRYDVDGLQKDGPDDKNRVKSRFAATFSSKPSNFDQTHPGHRRLTLNVGGYANLYEGTSIKVKCPVKNFEKQRIFWTKDGLKVKNSAHIKVSGNGALRIFHARLEDAGLYACVADGVQGNVTLRFKTRPAKGTVKASEDPTELKSANDVDEQLLQAVRDSLYKLGELKAYDKVKQIHEPGLLKVDYEVGDWSACTQTKCNDIEGSQVRLLRCRLKVEGVVAYVNEEICDSFAVQRPQASKSCRNENCPKWEASDWSECGISRCSRDGISISRRDVKCVYPNSTVADSNFCERKTRPKIKKECQNLNCTAEWKTSVWGKCSKKCDDGGVQMRILRCVWKGTKKPAGHNCDPSQRPAAIRACAVPDLPPCYQQADAPSNAEVSVYHSSAPQALVSEGPLDLEVEGIREAKPIPLPIPAFKGWERWRGWRDYNGQLPQQLRRLVHKKI
ncbi:unnamed protein product [Bursaphelenchus okinawaensis]|uniref:Ig-like domain-containing protein n=1 Tax=Bursaphelenchus okinawaensis TaxID=465554 RepID=A0A811JS06_9BILA|nr:unnamed protein product [Bursaphelenchus okinawaensis]CAG9080916.1 unnamed protein product [Bursaphelenchus okinawaensis]